MKIGTYDWKVILVDRKEIDNADGRTFANDFVIKIADDLKGEARKLTFLHEITHATLSCQGRWYQKRFSQEEVCEFIAYTHDETERLLEEFIREVGL